MKLGESPFALALSVIINVNRTHLRRDCPAHLGEGYALCEGKRACHLLQHTAYVSIRQNKSAYVSIRKGYAICEGKRACHPLYAVVRPFVHVDALDVFDEHVD